METHITRHGQDGEPHSVVVGEAYMTEAGFQAHVAEGRRASANLATMAAAHERRKRRRASRKLLWRLVADRCGTLLRLFTGCRP
jgi:hypothetical protein